MPHEIVHFRGSDKILREKRLDRDLAITLNYVGDVLHGKVYRGGLLRLALNDLGWRENGNLKILEGRGYRYKGWKRGVAIEGSFAAYEFILEGLLRLEIGFRKGLIDCGVLLLTSKRSEKSSLGTSKNLAVTEVQQLHPIITVPVSIALFDLGPPIISDGWEEEAVESNSDPLRSAAQAS